MSEGANYRSLIIRLIDLLAKTLTMQLERKMPLFPKAVIPNSAIDTVRSTQRKSGFGILYFPPETQTAFSIIVVLTTVPGRLPFSQGFIARYFVK